MTTEEKLEEIERRVSLLEKETERDYFKLTTQIQDLRKEIALGKKQ